jgi:hypothetical protein
MITHFVDILNNEYMRVLSLQRTIRPDLREKILVTFDRISKRSFQNISRNFVRLCNALYDKSHEIDSHKYFVLSKDYAEYFKILCEIYIESMSLTVNTDKKYYQKLLEAY